MSAEPSAPENARLARMFEHAPNLMALLDGAEHRFILANAQYLKLVGGREVLGKTVAEALPDAGAQGYLKILDEVFQTGRPYSANSMRFIVQGAKDSPSTEHFIDFFHQPIADEQGRVSSIFVCGTDVSDRVRAQASLEHSEVRWREANVSLEQRIAERTTQLSARETLIRTFYQHSSECHAILSEVEPGIFKYEDINPATLRLYGLSREQVIGHSVHQIFDAKTAAELNAHLTACLRVNAPYQYERAHGDGVVEAIATPVPQESGLGRRLVVSARDVTERRRLEQQLRQSQKMEAIGQLTGGIAHDFNNLLTSIIGSLEILNSRISQGRYLDLDRYIIAGQAAAKRAAALTHRLLAFARRQTLDAKPTDLNRLIGDMVEMISRSVGPEIKVEVIGAVGLWQTMVDGNQMENALLNLCINARDAMPKGGKITIETANRWLDERLAAERELSSGQYVSMCVSDNGCGMPAEVIARAFDPFFTTKPLGQGTGLGLSMIYGFARQSGGQARIYSEVGRGTTVCIYLPRHHGAHMVAEDSSESEAAPLAKGETVLVVDDEPAVRMLIEEVLHDLGCICIESPDGVAALEILQSSQAIDLLITDVGLPNGINGRQLADAARLLRPGLKILFITGYAENAAFSHGLIEAGMELLSKPFPMDLLAKRVAAILNRKP
jgi:PAS domain S-box-containing protein